MKKLIAMLLVAVMVMSFAACGTINDTEVSILWSGDGIVHVPNSLINAMERAMYIESISYTHHGANGDQAEQTKQAHSALNAGCSVLVVELVDPAAAQEIVDAAKAKNVPVIFMNSSVDAAVLNSYDKCISVVSDDNSVGAVLGELIVSKFKKSKFVFSEFKKKEFIDITDFDRNKDGKLSYVAIGDVASTISAMSDLPLEAIAEITDVSGIGTLVSRDGATKKDLGQLITASGASVELIITADDATAQEILKALQKKGFNSNKLTTHCIPLYTVGNEVDAKSFKNADDYEEEEWAALIYTTTDLISSGFIAGAAVTDYDGTAIAVASVVSDLIKGTATNSADSVVNVPFTTN